MTRTKNIPHEDKPTVYVGALGNKGPQGWDPEYIFIDLDVYHIV